MIRVLVVAAMLALVIPGNAAADHVPDGEALVVRVVDGDTIDVQTADGNVYRVRIIGIDTPETVAPGRSVQCFGPEASARTHELLDGQTVWLERDVSDTDRFGRLTRYVWLGDQLVEHLLLSEGVRACLPVHPRYATGGRICGHGGERSGGGARPLGGMPVGARSHRLRRGTARAPGVDVRPAGTPSGTGPAPRF